MVDVRAKPVTDRLARAEAVVRLGPALLAEVLARSGTKGDALRRCRLAGIAAVKRTSELIPLAHPLAVHHAAVDFVTDAASGEVRIVCTAAARERTGVEMEAMTGATVAALTVYDMCKGRDRSLQIGPIRLLEKAGGASGAYRRAQDEAP